MFEPNSFLFSFSVDFIELNIRKIRTLRAKPFQTPTYLLDHEKTALAQKCKFAFEQVVRGRAHGARSANARKIRAASRVARQAVKIYSRATRGVCNFDRFGGAFS